MADHKIKILINEVVEINKEQKTVSLKNNQKISYEKLVLATGSLPVVPGIKGIDKKGIYPIKKRMSYLKEIYSKLKKSKNVIIVGGGYIGVELADELSKNKNLKISIIEMMPTILPAVDKEFSDIIARELKQKKVNVITNTKVIEFKGDEKVKAVVLSNKKTIKADLVILGMGAFPNSSLAEKSGLKISKFGAIKVNKYQMTSDKNIFAVGDCAYKEDAITKKESRALLASTAVREARICGANLYKLKFQNKGTVAVYSTKVGNTSFGCAGITEKIAKEEKIEIITGEAETFDKHPSGMPNSSKIKIKLIFSKRTRLLLGGEVVGGDSTGEIINIIGTAIQNRMGIEDLQMLEIGTHPKLTPSPIAYPLIIAAQNASKK